MLLMSHVAMPMLDEPAETTMIGRWFRLRLAGLLLATASIASVLYENQARPLMWFLLAVTAHRLATIRARPRFAQPRCACVGIAQPSRRFRSGRILGRRHAVQRAAQRGYQRDGDLRQDRGRRARADDSRAYRSSRRLHPHDGRNTYFAFSLLIDLRAEILATPPFLLTTLPARGRNIDARAVAPPGRIHAFAGSADRRAPAGHESVRSVKCPRSIRERHRGTHGQQGQARRRLHRDIA